MLLLETLHSRPQSSKVLAPFQYIDQLSDAIVNCPRVGDPEPCNGRGTCLDTGVCECEVGWDGEYCEVGLTVWELFGTID